MDHAAYIASCLAERAQPSFLFQSPGFELHHVCIDSMHSADLGCFQDAIGSLLTLEISSRLFYVNKAKGLEQLNQALTHYYSRNPTYTRATPLQFSQLVDSASKFPTFKGKAAQRAAGKLRLSNNRIK